MTTQRERDLGLAVALAMDASPMVQGPNGELLDSVDELNALEKRLTPPAGYSLAPRSKIGAYRKRKGKGWVYWDPRDSSKRLPGGDEWWRHYGMRKPPGDWAGVWADTSVHDPAGYDKQGVLDARDKMLALREARKTGNVPEQLVEAAALFAITSKRTDARTQERVWPQIDAWLASEDRDPDALRDIMRPLGMQNQRLVEFGSIQKHLHAIRSVMLRHPEDGRAARREMLASRMFKGLGAAKASFVLEILGYSDVACIDAMLVRYLTGSKRGNPRLGSALSKKLDLYEAFEDALSRTQAHRESDPEEVRLGMAQWRAWDHERGSDTDHAVFWDSARRVMGEIIKAGENPDLLAAAIAYSADRFGLDHPAWYHILRGI